MRTFNFPLGSFFIELKRSDCCCKIVTDVRMKHFLSLAFRIVQPADVSTENCEDICSRRGQQRTPFLIKEVTIGASEQLYIFIFSMLLFQHTGSAATRAHCSEAGDVCPICQGEYRDPRVLICQVKGGKTHKLLHTGLLSVRSFIQIEKTVNYDVSVESSVSLVCQNWYIFLVIIFKKHQDYEKVVQISTQLCENYEVGMWDCLYPVRYRCHSQLNAIKPKVDQFFIIVDTFHQFCKNVFITQRSSSWL